ncbi:DUF1669 domain-containing protein [Clostridium sp. 19966]|uniref:phospholipase D-like domain-containing protein n=1 Tax=Clostridium sp. 19966 TaxID=2768166 RepID=UPI0028E03C68|nr:phospholipase D-like domain-containing protein [Clostridium sp. 19966]MDT8718293.1 DUF1669 domain-containing protein [Clostridium sp. 19966]
MKKIIYSVLIGVSIVLPLSGCDKLNQNSIKNLNENEVGTYFTQADQHPDQQLISLIDSSKSSLDIAIYSLTKKEIVNAIAEASKRGVKVRVITDNQESSSKSEKSQLSILKKEKVPVEINRHAGLMHLKVTIVDNQLVTTGSYNYTDAASKINDEVLVVIKNKNIAEEFEKQFNRMFNDKTNFNDY